LSHKYFGMFNKLLICILVIILPYQMISSAYYMHYHYKKDGTVTAHAHPYSQKADKGAFPEHNHSESELMILEMIQQSLPLLVLVLFIFKAAQLFFFCPHVEQSVFLGNRIGIIKRFKRGPPIFTA